MAVLKPADYQSLIKKEGPPPVVFLFGDEKYLIDLEAKKLKAKGLSGAIEDFNYDKFTSQKMDWVKFEDTLGTLPMMSPKRVVELEITKDLVKKDGDSLLEIAKACPDSSLLIIKAIELDARKAYSAKLQKNFTAVRYYSPFPNEIPKWISKFCKAEALTVEPDASSLIYELVGGKLIDLESAVTRIKLFLGNDSKRVDLETVETVLAKTKADSVFDFTKYVGQNQRFKALEALRSLKEQGQNEVGCFALLNRHIGQLYITKNLLDKGEDRFAIARALGVAPFFAKDYIDQSSFWSEAKLKASIHALSVTDKALKSSPLPPSVWLENFVIKICR